MVNGQAVNVAGSFTYTDSAIIGGLLSAGQYQINVQIPSNAANGDQPEIVQSGTASSVSTMITIQK